MKQSNYRTLNMSPATAVKLLSVTTIGILAGCSNQQIYETIYLNEFRACEEAPIQVQQACREQYSISYEDYDRMRNEVLAESEDH